jgi:hypothetical protein
MHLCFHRKRYAKDLKMLFTPVNRVFILRTLENFFPGHNIENNDFSCGVGLVFILKEV